MKKKLLVAPLIASIILTSAMPVFATTYDGSLWNSSNSSFKAYMDYRTITSKTSKQYKLQQQATTNEYGVRQVDGKILVAVGTGFGASVGDSITFKTDTGRIIDAIVGDIKQDRHTDSTNMQVAANGNVIEFIIDKDVAHKGALKAGSFNVLQAYNGNVISVDVHDGKSDINYVDAYMQEHGANGMPTEIIHRVFGRGGTSYGEYSIKNPGLGYQHWDSFKIEEKEGKEWFASDQMQMAVHLCEMSFRDFKDASNGLKLPSSSLCEDKIEDLDASELESKRENHAGYDSGKHIRKPDIIGSGTILDMPTYINQGTCAASSFVRYTYKDKNGKIVNSTIAKSGCLDCSIAMAYIYYYGDASTDTTELLTKKISCNVVPGESGALNTSYVLSQLNLTRGDKVYPASYAKTPDADGKKSVIGWGQLTRNIDLGNPVLLHIRGQWGSYHTSDNGHFLLATGYDEEGIYVYDPGKRANTESGKPIPWEAWNDTNQSELYYQCLGSSLKQ